MRRILVQLFIVVALASMLAVTAGTWSPGADVRAGAEAALAVRFLPVKARSDAAVAAIPEQAVLVLAGGVLFLAAAAVRRAA